MGHDHDHGPPNPTSVGKAFAIGIALNSAFVIVEVIYGLLAHSMALVADAGHNLGDVLGLVLSWAAAIMAKRAPTSRRTYGFRATTILASLTNGVVLLFVTGGIAWESARRLFAPGEPAERTIIVVALVGVVVNATSALLFMKGRKGDLNVRSAFLHLASDAVLALGVAIAGGVMMITGWSWLDPVTSIALSLVILVGTWSLLRGALKLALHAVPDHIDPEKVKEFLLSLPDVREVHDLHIWSVSTTEVALTAHLVMPLGRVNPDLLQRISTELRHEFDIDHSTVQIESPDAEAPCEQAPAESL